MIFEIDGKVINVNIIIFDSVSLQAWSKDDGRMILNMRASDIKEIIVKSNG